MAPQAREPFDVESGEKLSKYGQNKETTNEQQSIEEAKWDGPEDPDNPYNWPDSRKIAVGIVCSISQLVTTMSASMLIPALDQILEEVGLSSSTGQIAFSVFFLGLGFAPLGIAPLAEVFGRKPVWLAGNVIYIFWNAMCPVGFSPSLMIIGRLLSGSGASVGITLTGPVLADMYHAKDRGKAVAIASLLPYLGPALGPIIGGVAAQYLHWPWLFWILSIFDVAGVILGYFVIRESYAPVLLRRKAEAMNAVANSRVLWKEKLCTTWERVSPRLGNAFSTPFQLLIFHPSIQMIFFGLAVEFGIYTLMLSTFAQLWQLSYHQSSTIASLHYISIAIGAFTCAQVGAPLMDLIWRRLRDAHPDIEPTPEYRLPYMLIGLILSIAGLFWYAWASEKVVYWLVVDFGAGIFTCGSFMFSQALFAYMLDEFPSRYSASANAASRVGTYVFGFAFPIFAPELYASLGYGWGTSVLGFILAALGVATTMILYIWGEKFRAIGVKRVQRVG